MIRHLYLMCTQKLRCMMTLTIILMQLMMMMILIILYDGLVLIERCLYLTVIEPRPALAVLMAALQYTLPGHGNRRVSQSVTGRSAL